MKIRNAKKTSGLCVLAALAPALAPATASAAAINVLEQVIRPGESITKTLELYGALRVSADYSDSDVGGNAADDNPLLTDGAMGVSSNTSMIGFRGEVPYKNGYKFLWQFEQQVDVDDTDEGDVFTTRDTFLALEGAAGTFLVGRINTPFKNLGVSYLGYFNTAVGDSHAILGTPSGAAGGRLDLLGSNSLNWKARFSNVAVALQYAADQAGSVNTVDENDRQSYSAWVDWQPGDLQLSSAFIHYADFFATGSLDAYRLFAKYKFGAFKLGAIYEDVRPDDFDALDRNAYGVQGNYVVVPRWTLVSQWNHAEESELGGDGADQYSLGLFHQLTEEVLVHAMYTTTRNDSNAAYRGVDYAHGDKVGTLTGGAPWSVSVGAQLTF